MVTILTAALGGRRDTLSTRLETFLLDLSDDATATGRFLVRGTANQCKCQN